MPRPHDLVRIGSDARLWRDGPDWLQSALHAAPWAVVRRARCDPGFVAVGIRGHRRSQRHAAVVDAAVIAEILSPPDLLDRVDRLPGLPAAKALLGATELLAPTGLCWGPGGSVGFTLATGVVAMTADSDLDLVITTSRMPAHGVLANLSAAFGELCVRVDCRIELPIGGVALAEVLRSDPVLVRTADGPILTSVAELAA